LAFTFLPGFSTVPFAEAVMFSIDSSSVTIKLCASSRVAGAPLSILKQHIEQQDNPD